MNQVCNYLAYLTINGLIIFFIMITKLPTVSAQDVQASADPMVEALQEIEGADWKHRWTGYGIAWVGSAIGIGMGSWGLYQQPLAKSGTPDPVIFSASLLLVGSATAQIIHGGMRFDERVMSAQNTRALLADPKAQKANGLFFLKSRAEKAQSTRFWGGVMTTAQGIGTTLLGARLWQKGIEGQKTAGIVFTVMGVLNTVVGTIHFPGKARSGRVLDRTLKKLGLNENVSINPTALPVDHQTWSPGLSAFGRF